MIENVKTSIRKRTREGWEQLASESVTDLRIWIQEHGEKSAIFSLVLGVFIVAAFRLFVFLVVVGLLLASVIWLVALPESEVKNVRPDDIDPESIDL